MNHCSKLFTNINSLNTHDNYEIGAVIIMICRQQNRSTEAKLLAQVHRGWI